MKEVYSIYWLMPDGTKVYHLDEEFGTPWRFYTYDEAYGAGHRLAKPSIEARLMFEVVER